MPHRIPFLVKVAVEVAGFGEGQWRLIGEGQWRFQAPVFRIRVVMKGEGLSGLPVAVITEAKSKVKISLQQHKT